MLEHDNDAGIKVEIGDILLSNDVCTLFRKNIALTMKINLPPLGAFPYDLCIMAAHLAVTPVMIVILPITYW